MTQLPNPQRTIDIVNSSGIINVDNPLPSAITNYREQVVLVNQSGSILGNQNGDTLVANVIRSARTGVITLGA